MLIDSCYSTANHGRLDVHVTVRSTAETSVEAVTFRFGYGPRSIWRRDDTFLRTGGNGAYVFPKALAIGKGASDETPLSCAVTSVDLGGGDEWPETYEPSIGNDLFIYSMLLGHGYLGMQMDRKRCGIVVKLMLPGGPARVAGVHQGDYLESIDEQRVESVTVATALIRAAAPGSHLAIGVLRNGKPMHLDAVVGTLPAIMELPGASQSKDERRPTRHP